MEIEKLFGNIYAGKRVMVTGHTGFKGSWLVYWLNQMGAKVSGIALEPPTEPSHFNLLHLNMSSNIQNIHDLEQVKKIIKKESPEIIFHLAAQPIVRLSYQDPINTYMTNVMGTVNVLEAARDLPDLKAIVVVTSDKCYDNKEWVWGYRENEPMGGKDPYSSSKGCAELITSAYRNSFFNVVKSNNTKILVASARAGNVIGGGDWASDRILTDIVTSSSKSKSVFLRYPGATRPWQHVLEPISGYLTLGWKLLEGYGLFADSWNFGPGGENNVSVLDLVKEANKFWKKISIDFDKGEHPHEAGFLMLDSSKSHKLLGWNAIWGFNKTVEMTIEWYRNYYDNNLVLTESTLRSYISDAQKANMIWSQK